MTSSGYSKKSRESEDLCPRCKGPMSWRPAYPYPIWLQTAFGLSFVVFLFVFQKLARTPLALWIWSGVQAILGGFLMRGRLRSKQRVLRCIRCEPPLR